MQPLHLMNLYRKVFQCLSINECVVLLCTYSIKLVEGSSDASGNMEHVCTFPHVVYPSDILWSIDVRGEVHLKTQVKCTVLL